MSNLEAVQTIIADLNLAWLPTPWRRKALFDGMEGAYAVGLLEAAPLALGELHVVIKCDGDTIALTVEE